MKKVAGCEFGGVLLSSGEAPEIRDCTITASSEPRFDESAGVRCDSASPIVTGCMISGNGTVGVFSLWEGPRRP